MRPPFRDRRDAGRQLALACRAALPPDGPPLVVLALPRGGVPVADEVASLLDATLDVLVVRKVGCPWQPELGVGALGEGGVEVLDDALIRRLRLTDDDLAPVIAREREELERRVRDYRSGRPMADVAGRAVVLVDDGIATGGTVRAAIEVLRRGGCSSITVAVPVAATDAVGSLSAVADRLVVLHAPRQLGAVGAAYADFTATSDREVADVLARRASPG